MVSTGSYPSLQTPQFAANSFNISWRECRSYRRGRCTENTADITSLFRNQKKVIPFSRNMEIRFTSTSGKLPTHGSSEV
jgi:hypothetical protein